MPPPKLVWSCTTGSPPCASKALDCAHQQALQTLGEIGAAEELDRVFILVRPLAQVHLPQVGGKLGLLVAATGDVPVRRHDLAPGLQIACRCAFDGRASAPAPIAAHLFIEDGAPELHLDLADLIGLRSRHRSQQALGRVERSISVVTGKGLLVRPLIAHITQFAHETALRMSQCAAEDVIPGTPT